MPSSFECTAADDCHHRPLLTVVLSSESPPDAAVMAVTLANTLPSGISVTAVYVTLSVTLSASGVAVFNQSLASAMSSSLPLLLPAVPLDDRSTTPSTSTATFHVALPSTLASACFPVALDRSVRQAAVCSVVATGTVQLTIVGVALDVNVSYAQAGVSLPPTSTPVNSTSISRDTATAGVDGTSGPTAGVTSGIPVDRDDDACGVEGWCPTDANGTCYLSFSTPTTAVTTTFVLSAPLIALLVVASVSDAVVIVVAVSAVVRAVRARRQRLASGDPALPGGCSCGAGAVNHPLLQSCHAACARCCGFDSASGVSEYDAVDTASDPGAE